MLKRLLSRAHMMLLVVIGLLLIFFILLFLLIFHCPCRVFLHAHTWSFTSLTAWSSRCDGLRIIESVQGGQKSLILFMRFVIGFAARSLATCIFAYLCMSVEATQIHCTCWLLQNKCSPSLNSSSMLFFRLELAQSKVYLLQLLISSDNLTFQIVLEYVDVNSFAEQSAGNITHCVLPH